MPIVELSPDGDSPSVPYVVFGTKAKDALGQPNLITLQEKGDHSTDDNIRRRAACILYFISATA
jgi:hypothetical protein